ncbi:ABC transporter permease [Actinomadura sp. HBU206391]|uniref:ABC transporter permease n=1 Tax=Actinomadura sp. HBU206391 TaxID=2731692 RepID=UPI00164EDF22|nr:ABC transporter permease [Actinomadura sp. HBU206391]MBC6460921.1 ABC transporter permease [Actinomadura sp. HBU206391]
MILLKLVLRGLAAHKLRLGLTALAVVLGVAFASGAMIFSATMDETVARLFSDQGEGTDVLVRAKEVVDPELGDTAAERPITASLVETLHGVTGVDKVHGSAAGFAAVLDRSGRPAGATPRIGLGWTDDPDFSIHRLRSGRGPRAPGEIALDAATAKETGHRVGDRVRVALRTESQSFTLTGVFTVGDSGAGASTSMVAFEPATAQRLLMERPGTYRQIAVHAEQGVPQERLRDAVAVALPSGLEAITGAQAVDEKVDTVRDILDVVGTFLLGFAAISIFVGSFIIFNTFSMLVARRTRELALLRAVGASRRQVAAAVLGEAAAVGLIGSTLGLALGGAVAMGLPGVFRLLGQELPSRGLTVPSSAVLWAYAIGTVVTVVAAYLPGRRAGRVPPVAAMRDGATSPGRSSRSRRIAGGLAGIAGAVLTTAGLTGAGDASGDTALALVGAGAAGMFLGVILLSPIVSGPATRVLGWPFAQVFGVTGRLGRQNAQRDPRRTAATASALMVGLALIGTVSVIAASLAASVNRQLDATLPADYRVTSQGSAPFAPEVRDAVARTPGVESVVVTRQARIALAGRTRTAAAGDPRELAGLHRLVLEEGTTALAADELLISRGTATSNGWSLGTTIPGRYPDGVTAGFRVAGVYADVRTILGTVPTTIISAEGYRAHDRTTLIDELAIVIAPEAKTRATRDALESALAPWSALELQDRQSIKEESGGFINVVLTLVLVLLALSVVIAALGIVNTLALSVLERTREIGLLRAVGMQRRQLRRMIRYEAVVISTFGALLGVGIGVVFGCAVQNVLADDGVEVLSIPFTQLGSYVLAGAGIGVVAAIWPAGHAARLDILRAISAD